MRTILAGAAAVVLSVAATGASALAIHQESFESAPGSGYALSSTFDDGGFDFFNRYAVPDVTNAARDDFSGWDGNFGIIGQDHDGDGFAATQTVTVSGINISGFDNLSVQISLGALDSEPNFYNFEAGDGFKLYAAIDGGAKSLFGAFAPSFNNTVAGDLLLDNDLDGVGDGTGLTVALADFSFGFAGSGSSLELFIEMTSTDSFETLALDNVRVSGDLASAVPLPAGLPLLLVAMGILGIARRRQT